MAIRVLFWNIENFFGDDTTRAQKVVDHVRRTNPDVVGFSEIKDKAALRSILQSNLSDYDFGITDGKEGIELLAGWKRGEFGQTLYTQRREFKVGNPDLRPGSLLSVDHGGSIFNFLFLHTDSGTKDKDYNNRQDMFEKIWAMRERLTEIEGQASHFAVLGDLNTMGKGRRGGAPAISAEQEITNLKDDAQSAGMRLLDKSHSNTWARVNVDGKITLKSNLDHVIVSDTLSVEGNDVATVRGWVDVESDAERLDFVEKISDHCSVECVIDIATG